jgi:two-component system, response regulator PdtaR
MHCARYLGHTARSDDGNEICLHRATMTVESSSVAAAAQRGLRVLIVEDESLVSLFLQGVLQDLGHSVSGVAPSLRTALAIAAGTPSDLAIVDIGLAGDGGDGIDAAVALRSRYGIPALLMTGASFADVGPRLHDAEPLGFLTKPYTESDVATALREALAKMQKSQAKA